MNYCSDPFRYSRRKSAVVQIGNTPLGGNNPIRIQSMTNTSTLDTDASAEQCVRILEAGADYVRLTAQGVREAKNLANIHSGLRARGFTNPLVADIHFNPKAAEEAAKHVEKVRINPGNFVDPVKTFRHFEYTDHEYAAELQKIRTRFVPFLQICKKFHAAVRIGVNHGSLSDRIMSRYGDTPEGMVESCMEFLRICVEEAFPDIAVSIKASNTRIMVLTVRLLVAQMNAEGMNFPLHLGVTEAGDGEDGRIKSAVGIGALLIDGIGDTIRVSLSEDPEREIPVAQKMVELIQQRSKHPTVAAKTHPEFNPYVFHRRETTAIGSFGGGQVPLVIADCSHNDADFHQTTLKPDFVYSGKNTIRRPDGIPQLCDASVYKGQDGFFPVFQVHEIPKMERFEAPIRFVQLSYREFSESLIQHLSNTPNLVLILYSCHVNKVAEQRAAFHYLLNEHCRLPVVMAQPCPAEDLKELQLVAGIDFGSLLLDGFGDGLLLVDVPDESLQHDPCQSVAILFSVLQASRLRMSKTEYISCPGCGRTLFDLQKTIANIKEQTSHLKNLKIGIMGCIVNGPGEMADADYGYVGAGRGEVSLYKGQQCVERGIPEAEAVEKLINLIRRNGDWIEKG